MDATKKKQTARYIQRATPLTISAMSKISVKVGDTFYTFEYSESRSVDQNALRSGTLDLNEERALLWEACHAQVDAQVQEVLPPPRK